MTPKERWLAALRMEAVDRLPFWPKINPAYAAAQDGRFRGMEVSALHEFIGSDQHIGLPDFIREVRTDTSLDTTADGDIRRLTYRTPIGPASAVHRYDPVSQAWHPIEFPAKGPENLRTLTRWYEDLHYEVDEQGFKKAGKAYREIGQNALAVHNIGTTPLMVLVEWLAGIANAHLLLADYPTEVETLFDAMQRALTERTRLICEFSPADAFYLTENTSTTLISPDQFRRYCAPVMEECGRIVQDFGGLLILHMCGHLRDLLPDLARVPAAAFEAFTSPTLGNTTLLDGRSACPDTCLIGGTNAMLWTRPASEIIATIERDLDALPHHRGIVVTSAGVMPPLCRPETIREVCAWVKRYPLHV